MAADWPPRPTGRRRNARRFAPVRRETRRAPQSSADRPESGGGGAGRSRGGGAAPAPQSAPERAAPAPPPERNKPRPGLPTTEPKRRRGERNPRRRLPRAGGGRKPARGEPTRPTRSGAGAARARRGGKAPPEWRNRGGAKPRPRRYHASEERDPNARGSGLSGHALPPKGASLCRSAAIKPPVWAVGQSAFPPRNVRRECAGTAPVGGWQPSDGALCIPSDLSDGIPRLSVHGGQPLYLILGHYSVSSMSLWTECL